MTPASVAGVVMVGENEESTARSARLHAAREPEVEDLDRAVGAKLDVRRLQVAMHDAGAMRRLQGRGDLARHRQRFVDRQRARGEPFGERLSFDQLQDQELRAVLILEPVDRGDVWVVERREHPRLALEPRQPVAVLEEEVRQGLDRDVPVQVSVPRAIDLAHAAPAERGDDLVRADAGSGREGHRSKTLCHRPDQGFDDASSSAWPASESPYSRVMSSRRRKRSRGHSSFATPGAVAAQFVTIVSCRSGSSGRL